MYDGEDVIFGLSVSGDCLRYSENGEERGAFRVEDTEYRSLSWLKSKFDRYFQGVKVYCVEETEPDIGFNAFELCFWGGSSYSSYNEINDRSWWDIGYWKCEGDCVILKSSFSSNLSVMDGCSGLTAIS